MKVLMIYPNQVTVVRVPLGLGYLASYLRQSGHEMELFDTTFIKQSKALGDDELRQSLFQVVNPKELNYNIQNLDLFKTLENKIDEFKPDILGLTVVDPNYQLGLNILRFCKKMWPQLPTVVGGPLTTFIPEDIIKEDCVEALGRGECETAFVEFCDKLEQGGWENTFGVKNFWIKDLKEGKIYKNKTGLFNLNKCLSPSMDIYDDRHFIRPLGGRMYRMATVIWTRGCLFDCSYCANRSLYSEVSKKSSEYYRIADVADMVENLKSIKEKYNLDFMMFVDDIWPMHKLELVREFCKLYKEYVDLPFSINVNCKIVREEAFELAVDAGLRNICVGVESGSIRIREKILNRFYTNEELQKVFDLAHKNKIRVSSFNMIGLPEETREDVMETIRLNRKLNPDSATVTIFHPYHGCSLRERCIKDGYISDNDPFEDIYRLESQLNMPQISKKDLRGLMNSFQFYFKLPEEMYGLIRKQEHRDTKEARDIREKIILPAFQKVQQESTSWNFTKRDKWWEN